MFNERYTRTKGVGGETEKEREMDRAMLRGGHSLLEVGYVHLFYMPI